MKKILDNCLIYQYIVNLWYLEKDIRNFVGYNYFLDVIPHFSKRFYGHNLVILRDVEYLHLMDVFERFIYYGNYFLSIFVSDFLFVLLIYLFFQKKIIKN